MKPSVRPERSEAQPSEVEGQLTTVGRSIRRAEGVEKVTGKARFTADLDFPGLLEGKVLRSPFPHALIESIDVSGAEALPGVRGVLTRESVKDEARQIVRQRLRELKTATARLSTARDRLHEALEESPALFVAPRTHSVDGIKFGYRKLPGKFEAADEAKAIERIRDKMPEQADLLIRTKETLSKSGLKKLTAKDLAKIGVTLIDDGDEVVIAAAKTDIDKLVDLLMPEDEWGLE